MVREAKRRKSEWAKGRGGVWANGSGSRRSVWAPWWLGKLFGEGTHGTYATHGTNVSEGLRMLLAVLCRRHTPSRPYAPAAAGPIRRFGACSCLSRHLGLVCHLSWAELQATPVAGGEVFRRRTRTLTFMDWVPAPLNVPRTGAASLASRPKETAICCSPHQQLLVGSKATQV